MIARILAGAAVIAGIVYVVLPHRRRARGRLCTWCAARLRPGQWQCAPGYGCRSQPLTPAEIERLLRP